jgi:hypothetical protein
MIERIAISRRKILDEQQKLREKDEAQKKMEDFDRFHKFSQQLESPDVSLRTQQAAAAPARPVAVSTPPVDARKADSFAELMENTEKRSRTAARDSQPSIVDMGFSSPQSASTAPATVAFSDPFAPVKPTQVESAGFGSLFSEIRPTSAAASSTVQPMVMSPSSFSFPAPAPEPAPMATFTFPSPDPMPVLNAPPSSSSTFSLPSPPSVNPALLNTNDNKKQAPAALISQLSQLYSQPAPVAPVASATSTSDEDDFFAAQIRPSAASPSTTASMSPGLSNPSNFEWGDPFASSPAAAAPQQSAAPARSPTFDFPF